MERRNIKKGKWENVEGKNTLEHLQGSTWLFITNYIIPKQNKKSGSNRLCKPLFPLSRTTDTDLYLSLGRSEVVRVLEGWTRGTAAGRRDREGKEKNRGGG